METWTATSSGLRVPLLQVAHLTDKAGALLALTVQLVAKIEPASNLPESLFRPPEGLQVTKVPFTQ